MSPFIVCWTERKAGEPDSDHWEAFERMTPAEGLYNALLADPVVYTVSISKPIRSSDYEVINDAD